MDESTQEPQSLPAAPGPVAPRALDGFDPVPALASELGLPPAQVAAALSLFDEGNSVPFFARYR